MGRRQRRRRRRRRTLPPRRHRPRRHAALIQRLRPWLWLLGAVPLTAIDLGRRIFLDNDEARFAVLAQDALARGAWLLPELAGRTYMNKPTLLVWLIAAASELAGRVTQLTAVVPSAVAALATAMVIYAFGRDLFGVAAGRYAALAAVATQGFVLHARLAMPDMLMTCFITAGVWMLWATLRERYRFAWLGFYGAAAAAFWAKGPAGLLPLLVGVVWVVVAGRPFRWGTLRLGRGLPVLLALIAPWWVLTVFASRSGAAEAVVIDQLSWFLPGLPSVSRVVDPLRDTFGILYPWVLVVPVVVVQAARFVRGRGAERDAVLLLLVWSAVVFGAVAMSDQQRLRYYLPLLPPVSLLIGWWVAGAVWRGRRVERIPWRLYAALAGVLGVASAVVFAMSPRWRAAMGTGFPASPAEGLLLLAAVGVMLLALLHGVLHDRLARGFALAWIASAVLVMGGYHLELGRLNAAADYPRLRARVEPLLAPGAAVAVLDVHDLPVAFYFERPVTIVRAAGDLPAVLARTPAAVAIVRTSTLATVPGRDALRVLFEDRLGLRAISVVASR